MSPFFSTSLALVTALLTTTPAWSQSAEDRLAIAQEYNSQAMADMDMGRVIEQMWRPMLDQIQTQQGITFSKDQLEQVRTLYLDTFSEPMLALMQGNAATMAELFSYDELVALRDFYNTDAGRSVMIKMPDILAANQPKIMAMVQSRIPAVMGAMQTILNLE